MMTKAASYGPFANACEDASAIGTGSDSSPLTVSLSPECKKGSYSLQIAVGSTGNNGNFWFTSSTMQFSSGTYRYIHLWVKPSRPDSWLTFHVFDTETGHNDWKTLKGDKNGDMWFRTGEDMAVNQWNELWLDLNKNDKGWVNGTVTNFSLHASNNSTFLFDDVYCSPGAYNTYHYFCDYLGSPRVMTNMAGQKTWSQSYYAFGGDRTPVATGNTHKFTGHIQDGATGQYYAKARYFTTQLGRWSQPEPLLQGVPKGRFLRSPLLLNPYVYCADNPLKYYDPSGLALVACNLPGIGATYLDDAFLPLVNDFIARASRGGVSVQVTEAFRTVAYQQALRQNPRAITPAQTSLHSAGFAIDVNYTHLPATQQTTIRTAAQDAGINWGGDFQTPDPVHFYNDPGGDRNQLVQDAQTEYNRLTGHPQQPQQPQQQQPGQPPQQQPQLPPQPQQQQMPPRQLPQQ